LGRRLMEVYFFLEGKKTVTRVISLGGALQVWEYFIGVNFYSDFWQGTNITAQGAL